jgi:hypothetical protein
MLHFDVYFELDGYGFDDWIERERGPVRFASRDTKLCVISPSRIGESRSRLIELKRSCKFDNSVAKVLRLVNLGERSRASPRASGHVVIGRTS